MDELRGFVRDAGGALILRLGRGGVPREVQDNTAKAAPIVEVGEAWAAPTRMNGVPHDVARDEE